MGGTLGSKTFPWPSAIGGSPLAQPLNQAQAVTQNQGTAQAGGAAPLNYGQLSAPQKFGQMPVPPQPPESPLLPAKFNPLMFGVGK